MQTFVLEGTDRDSMRNVAIRVWNDLKLTGEMGLRPLGDGRWRIELFCERDLKASELERLDPLKQLC